MEKSYAIDLLEFFLFENAQGFYQLVEWRGIKKSKHVSSK